MLKRYWNMLSTALEARSRQERVLLLLASLVVLGYAGFVFMLEPMQLSTEQMQNRALSLQGRIAEEINKQSEINASYSEDPASFARDRQSELRRSLAEADQRLGELYGQLIDPQQMSAMLGQLLTGDSQLEIVSLNNLSPVLLGTSTGAQGGAEQSGQAGVEVYRHGLRMVFEGSYKETIRFLQRLEGMEANFFWENMEYTVTSYPLARITLDIYTLSTKKGWLSV